MKKALCPCGSNKVYDVCCAPYIRLQNNPLTPEALMRSRYTAYTMADTDYIAQTMQGKALLGFDKASARLWAARAEWLDLRVVDAKEPTGDIGYVEFIARFIEDGHLYALHEVSEFHKKDGRWFYVDGKQLTRAPEKLLRNGACPCRSGKKYKQCHGKA